MKIEWKKLNRKTYAVLLILLALLSVTIFVTGIFAKYVVSTNGVGTIGAKKFYFESDTLTAENPEYTLVSTTQTITFTLKNYKDDVNVSEMDIHYTVTVQAKNTKTETPVAAPSVTNGNATLTTSNKEAEITLSGLTEGNTYVVTVEGDGGYKKTLQATFIILEKDLGLYMNVKDGDRVALTVLVSEASGTVSITIPSGLILDKADDPDLDGVVVNGSIFTYSLDQKQSKVFYFLKEDPSKRYSATDFTVTMNDQEATIVDILDS